MPDDVKPVDVPAPPEGWIEREPWLADSYATDEDERFTELGETERQRAKSKRNVHSVLSWCVPASVAFAFILFWVGVAIYAWHLFMPPERHWLSPDQQKELHTILFSGAVGAIVAQGAKRYLE